MSSRRVNLAHHCRTTLRHLTRDHQLVMLDQRPMLVHRNRLLNLKGKGKLSCGFESLDEGSKPRLHCILLRAQILVFNSKLVK